MMARLLVSFALAFGPLALGACVGPSVDPAVRGEAGPDERALPDPRELLKARPADVALRRQVVEMLLAQGEFVEAQEVALAGTLRDAADARCWMILATVYRTTLELLKAREALELGFRNAGNDADRAECLRALASFAREVNDFVLERYARTELVTITSGADQLRAQADLAMMQMRTGRKSSELPPFEWREGLPAFAWRTALLRAFAAGDRENFMRYCQQVPLADEADLNAALFAMLMPSLDRQLSEGAVAGVRGLLEANELPAVRSQALLALWVRAWTYHSRKKGSVGVPASADEHAQRLQQFPNFRLFERRRYQALYAAGTPERAIPESKGLDLADPTLRIGSVKECVNLWRIEGSLQLGLDVECFNGVSRWEVSTKQLAAIRDDFYLLTFKQSGSWNMIDFLFDEGMEVVGPDVVAGFRRKLRYQARIHCGEATAVKQELQTAPPDDLQAGEILWLNALAEYYSSPSVTASESPSWTE